MKAGLTLKDFVESAKTEMTNNHMCRMIAGEAPDSGRIINDDWLLDLAIHNLRQHYEIVGTVAQLEEAVTLFSKVLDWNQSTIPNDNMSSNAETLIDEGTLLSIREFNALDSKLYDFVSKGMTGSNKHMLGVP